MRIGICDDLREELAVTEELCRQYLDEHKIDAEIQSATDWDALSADQIDLLILDIEMPGRSGIDIKEELSQGERPLIIFTTGYEDYMPSAFGKNVIGFLQKPLEKGNFERYMDCGMKLIIAGKKLSLENGSEVSTERVSMITADNRYTTVFFDDGKRSGLQLKSLSSWEEELKDVYFIRISQSVLVNCKFVLDFADDVITMESGEKLKTSRRRKKNCYERFMEYNRKYAKPR